MFSQELLAILLIRHYNLKVILIDLVLGLKMKMSNSVVKVVRKLESQQE